MPILVSKEKEREKRTNRTPAPAALANLNMAEILNTIKDRKEMIGVTDLTMETEKTGQDILKARPFGSEIQ